ncbi:MAG: hypothetical protein HQK70_14485 [Desulfamplus sp.]|nr:hypothetical protein [Desulfamplus sp.]
MFFRKSNSETSGLEINSKSIRFITVGLKNGIWSGLNHLEIDLPDGLVKPYFNKKNIQNCDQFQDILQQLRAKVKTSICPIGVSLPGESVKFSVKAFPKLPEGDQNIKDMLLWSLSKSSMINPDAIELKWAVFKREAARESNVSNLIMAGIASKDVLNEYVDALKKALFLPRYVSSSDLNLFNFYSSSISEVGTVAWLGIFPDSISLFVFKDAVLLFYKNLKKNLIAQNDADNIDMLIQYCMDENPDLKVEKYYLSAASSCFENRLSQTIFHATEYQLLSPFDLISIDSKDKDICWQYASAVGAAWSTISI